MTSRAAPEFWQLYYRLPTQIQSATQKAYRRFVQNLLIPAFIWNGYVRILAPGQFG